MEINYVRLNESDIPLIQQIGRATYEPYYPHIWFEGGIDWYMHRCFNREVLEKELSDPNYVYYFPKNEKGEIMGLLKLVLQQTVPGMDIPNALYLEKIYLMPAFFGKGAGRLMMEFVFETAAGLGREAVWLMVLKNGPVDAYRRAGFEVIGETHWPFDLLKPEERDGLVMLKILSIPDEP